MAIDVYLQIDGIKGESMDDKHKDWIECLSVNWSVLQPRSATASTGGGHTAERVRESVSRAPSLPLFCVRTGAPISNPTIQLDCQMVVQIIPDLSALSVRPVTVKFITVRTEIRRILC